MTKLLPCKTKECKGSAETASGEPLLSARFVARYVCGRCRKVQTLTATDWARLPPLKLEDWDALGKKHAAIATRDLEGAGLTNKQARDLFQKGFTTSHHVAELSRNA